MKLVLPVCVTLWWIGPRRFVPCRWTVWRVAPRTAKVGERCFRLQQTFHTLLCFESSTAFRYRAQGNLKGAIRYVMHCDAVHVQLCTHYARWVLSCTASTARPWPLIHATSSPSLTAASWYTCTAFVPKQLNVGAHSLKPLLICSSSKVASTHKHSLTLAAPWSWSPATRMCDTTWESACW